MLINKISNRFKLSLRVLLHGERGARPPRPPIPPLTPEEVAEAQAFFPLPKFFVFGHARSGTTLLHRMIAAHPDVHCNRQTHFFTRLPTLAGLVNDPDVAVWLARPSFRWNRGRDLSPVIMRAAADFILEREARAVGKSIVGDKSPNSLLNGRAVNLLHDTYPDARLVFIVRDGRDAVLSHRFQSFIDATQHLTPADWRIRAEFIRDPDAFHALDKSLFTDQGIERAAAGWRENVEATHARGQALFREQYHALRFEDLLADPPGVMRRVWAFLGADPDLPGLDSALQQAMQENRDAAWQEQKAAEMAGFIPKGKKGSWREFFSTRDKAVFQAVAGETLRAWGYGAAE